jgi:hypothetical protein
MSKPSVTQTPLTNDSFIHLNCLVGDRDLDLSIVTSDSILIRAQRTAAGIPKQRWVMNRFQWIQYAQILFDQLQKTKEHDLVSVNLQNYISALDKILELLPLQEFYEGAQKMVSFEDVRKTLQEHKEARITMDDVLDCLLH